MELTITASDMFYMVTRHRRGYYFSCQDHLDACKHDLEDYCRKRGYDFIVKQDHIENIDRHSDGRVLKLVGDPKDLVHFKLKYL